MLHGIYGRGRNWLAVARMLVERRPDWCCWLADMRHHGDAHAGADRGTLDALAGDIESWGAAQGVTPDAVLGHSFGGKVALAYDARQAARPLQTWVIDSTPEAKPPSGSAWDMLGIVRRLPQAFRSRQEAIAGIEAGGFSTEVAQWMSTNLVHDADAFRWRLDFDVMEHLLHEFFQTSMWPVLDPGAPGHDIHVLKASAVERHLAGRRGAAWRPCRPRPRADRRAGPPASPRGWPLDSRRVAGGGGGPAGGVARAPTGDVF